MPTLIKRSNGIFYAILSDEHGRRKWVSTREKTLSHAIKRVSELALLSPDAPISSVTLKKYYSDFTDSATSSYSKETLGIYKRAFDNFISVVGDLELCRITQRHIDLFKNRRLGKIRPVTLNIELRTLRAAFYTAVRWKLLSENPFKQVKLCPLDEEAPLYFSMEGFHSLLAAVRVEWLRDIILVAVLTGMRRGELLNLRWETVDLGRRTIGIQSHGKFRTKLGKRRTIPMNVQVLRVLQEKHEMRNGEYVFQIEGNRISERRLTNVFKRCVRRAGLDDRLHFHSLRHSFASWLVQNNVSIYQVQKLLGHSNIRVTEIYSHLLPEAMQNTVDKLQVRI